MEFEFECPLCEAPEYSSHSDTCPIKDLGKAVKLFDYLKRFEDNVFAQYKGETEV